MLLAHLLLPAVYSLLFLVTFRQAPLTQFGIFTLGVYIGFGLLFLDRVLHVFFVAPETEFNRVVQSHWHERRYWQVFRTLLYSGEAQEQLVTRSMFFLIAYVATALFVITSTGSTLGIGIILGVGLHYCFDFVRYRKNLELLHRHFLWQLKRQLADQEVTSLFMVVCISFLLLTVLAFAGHV